MIPFFEWKTIDLGFTQLPVFGILVVLAIFTGVFVSSHEARIRGLERDTIDATSAIALVSGLFIGNAFSVIFYTPSLFRLDPMQVFYFWKYLSSLGAFLGGTFFVVLFLYLRRKPILPYCDCIATGLVAAMLVGRIGCTLVHDHPGKLSNFPLAIKFPGGARHDLGFYELILLIIMAIVIFTSDRTRMAVGRMVAMIGAFYMTIRFFLDFLRVGDQKYWELTPAQYGCLILGGICYVVFLRLPKRKPVSAS